MDIEDPDNTITRLLNELRGAYEALDVIKAEIGRVGPDYDRMSPVGAIRQLAGHARSLAAENRRLHKELDRLICK